MLTPYEFEKLCQSKDIESLILGLFEQAEARWIDDGIEALTTGQLTILCVEIVFFEVCNGGIWQFLNNPSGQLAVFTPPALRRIQMPDYAVIVDEALSRCEITMDTLPGPEEEDDSPNWYFFIPREEFGLHAFEDLDEKFFALKRASEGDVTERLYQFIVNHEDEFAAPD